MTYNNMIYYYALTITPTSQKPYTVKAFEYALDRYEAKFNIKILDRFYEIAPRTKKLHVHCLIKQDNDDPEMEFFEGQRNHNCHIRSLVTMPDRMRWYVYSTKEKRTVKAKTYTRLC